MTRAGAGPSAPPPRPGRLAAAAAAYVAWLALLAAMAWRSSSAVVLSTPQLRVSELIVRGSIGEPADGNEPPDADAWTVDVQELFQGELDDRRRLPVQRTLLDREPIAGRQYIWPLMRAGDVFQVTRYPIDAAPRIYPADPSTTRQLRAILGTR